MYTEPSTIGLGKVMLPFDLNTLRKSVHLTAVGDSDVAFFDMSKTLIIGSERVRLKWNGEAPYREIGFGFVIVRAARAGEAQLRGRARRSIVKPIE